MNFEFSLGSRSNLTLLKRRYYVIIQTVDGQKKLTEFEIKRNYIFKNIIKQKLMRKRKTIYFNTLTARPQDDATMY